MQPLDIKIITFMFIKLSNSFIIVNMKGHINEEVKDMYFAEYMKKLRKDKLLTQSEMADILGISSQAIKMIENGSTRFPSKAVLDKLSDYLDKVPVAIASAIIFGDDDYKKDEQGYLSCRYLAYKYINGWNLDEVPIELECRTESISFSGKISKRREPKNTSIIIEICEFIGSDPGDLTIEGAYDILATIMTIVAQNEESFRRVEVLFDINDYHDINAFDMLENLKIYRLPTDLVIVLFDPNAGSLCKEVNVRK